MTSPRTRRNVLKGIGASMIVGLAGCSSSGNDDGETTGTEDTTDGETTTADTGDVELVEEDLADKLSQADMIDDTLMYMALDEDDRPFVTYGGDEHQSFFDVHDPFHALEGDLVYQATVTGDDGNRPVIVRGGEVIQEGRIRDVDDDILWTESANGEETFYDGGSRIAFDGYGPVEDAVYVDEGVAAVVGNGDGPNVVIKDGEVLDQLSDGPTPDAIEDIETLTEIAGDPVYDVIDQDDSQGIYDLVRDGEVVFDTSRPDNFSPAYKEEVDDEMAVVLEKREDIDDESRSKLAKLWVEGDEFGPHEEITNPASVDGEIAYKFQDPDQEGTRVMHGGEEIGTEYRSVGIPTVIDGSLAYGARLSPGDRPEDTPDKDQVVVYGDTEFGPYNQVGNIFEYEGGLAFVAQTEEDELYASRKLFHEE